MEDMRVLSTIPELAPSGVRLEGNGSVLASSFIRATVVAGRDTIVRDNSISMTGITVAVRTEFRSMIVDNKFDCPTGGCVEAIGVDTVIARKGPRAKKRG